MYFKSSKYEPWHFFPSPIFVQILSNAKKWQHFKLQWTEFGQAVDFHVQSVSRRFWIWHKFDRDLTRLRQQLDKPSTWPISGLTLDRDLTMFGQRLDFLSSLCPTIQCQVVPPCALERENYFSIFDALSCESTVYSAPCGTFFTHTPICRERLHLASSYYGIHSLHVHSSLLDTDIHLTWPPIHNHMNNYVESREICEIIEFMKTHRMTIWNHEWFT